MSQKQKRIVIVDDVNFYLLSIKERLKSEYEVFPVTSTAKMYDILGRITPDLILLDIGMPDSDGFETLKQLKDNPDHADIPVIFLTGMTDKASALKGIALGAADYLTKPVSTENLIESIEYQLYPERRKNDRAIILAVDDSPTILASVKHALSADYDVFTLTRSDALSAVLKKMTPDLFLLDVQMPGLSGYELIPIIRDTHGHEDTPIVFLTGDSIRDNLFAAIQLGASDFITKPVDADVLRGKMTVHLKNYRLQRRVRAIIKK